MVKHKATLTDDQTPRGHLDEGGIHDLIGYQLAQATIVTNRDFFREVGQPLQLGRVEFTVLQLVKANDGVSPTRIARAIALQTPSITVAVDKLVARGWLLREKSAADKRGQHLRLTPEGEAVAADTLHRLRVADRKTLGHLSIGEQHIFLELLRKVARATSPD